MYRVRNLKYGGTTYSRKVNMKDRIRRIMIQERLNQKEFAATTGISPATLSSIFNGRTSPTLNHAEALHRRFPNLNMSWLMFGEGDMYIKEGGSHGSVGDDPNAQSGDLFGEGGMPEGFGASGKGDSSEPQFDVSGGTPRMPMMREVVKYVDKPQRRITSITIFFDDGSFETFPGK